MNVPGRANGYFLALLVGLGLGLLVVVTCAVAGIPSRDYWEGIP